VTYVEQATQLADRLRKVPNVSIDFESFPSGAAMIDVRLRDRVFVLACFPSRNLCGVDELGDDEIPFTYHYKYVYPDFDSAATQLLTMLEDARRD